MAEYTIENYRLNVSDGSFTRVASYITPDSGLEFYKRLNGAGQMSLSFDVHDPALNPDDLKIYRNNFLVKRNGGAAWLGPLTGYDVDMTSKNGTVNMEVMEYFHHLAGRYTDQNYQKSSTEAGQIAWDLINTVQSRTNGNLGIQQGGIETTDSTNTILEYAEVASAIADMSDNIASFDFYLSPVLDAYSMLDHVNFNVAKSRYRNIVDKKITADQIISISTSTKRELFNTTTGLAYGTGDTILTSTAENSGSQTGYTRREKILKLADYRIQSNLDSAITEITGQNSVQTNTLNLTLDPAGKFNYENLEVGDVVQVDLRSSDFPPLLRLYGTVRVYEINVRVDQNGVEFITPKIKFI